MLFEMADDDRQRVEEPRTLIPNAENVENVGHRCGNISINLVMENLECAMFKLEKQERERQRQRQR